MNEVISKRSCLPLVLGSVVVRSAVVVVFFGLGCASVPEVESRGELDILFINGIVIDGSGEERYEADVGIVGDLIQVIGQDLEETYDARRVIDIAGASSSLLDTSMSTRIPTGR